MTVRRHWSEWLALAVFTFMALCCYARLFISVGFLGRMDESYWVASALMSSLGGTPFVNDMHVQQIGSMLYEPLVFVYYKLFGNSG